MKTKRKQSKNQRKQANKWAEIGIKREDAKTYQSRKSLPKVLIVCDDKKSAVQSDYFSTLL